MAGSIEYLKNLGFSEKNARKILFIDIKENAEHETGLIINEINKLKRNPRANVVLVSSYGYLLKNIPANLNTEDIFNAFDKVMSPAIKDTYDLNDPEIEKLITRNQIVFLFSQV